MRVASIIDISLVDVPGIPVTVIFTGGCNFDCPYCQNASLIPPESGDVVDLDNLVSSLQGFLSDGFCITGGEPTLHKDLPEFLALLKTRIGGHINLNTQGSVPSILKKSLPYLDSIWFDLKASPTRYAEVCRTNADPWPRVQESIDCILSSSTQFWPRTTYVGNLMTLDDLRDIIEYLKDIDFEGRYTIQNYVPSVGVREDESEKLALVSEDDVRITVESSSPSFEVDLDWR
ncbi:MAG: anaerobic ribonucleoside-triphosphate reductase activating protein [Candidatus Thorarchaeota archaeon]